MHPKSFRLEIRDTWFCQPPRNFTWATAGDVAFTWSIPSERSQETDLKEAPFDGCRPNWHQTYTYCLNIGIHATNFQCLVSCYLTWCYFHTLILAGSFISQWWRCQGCQEYTSVNLAESYMAKGHGDLGGTLAMGERWGSGWTTIKYMATSWWIFLESILKHQESTPI